MIKIKIEYEGWMAYELGIFEEEVVFQREGFKVLDLIQYLKSKNIKYRNLFENYKQASYIAINNKECFDENHFLKNQDNIVFHMQKVGG